MALANDAISNEEALILREELDDNANRRKSTQTRVKGFTLDLNLAQTNQNAARVEELIDKFDEITVFSDFTTGIG
jgi:hypothetical protein